MPTSHPPSRLSPPPGVNLSALLDSAGAALPSRGSIDDGQDDTEDPRDAPGPSTSGQQAKRGDAPKRGYRACVHCRLRKARCNLGDVNAPSEPPCSRCRREQRNCVFLPSKRRRKTGPDASEEGSTSTPAEAKPARKSAPPTRDGVLPQYSGVIDPALAGLGGPSGGMAASDTADWKSLGPMSMQSAGQTFQNWGDTISTSMFQNPVSRSPVFSYPDLPQRQTDQHDRPPTLQHLNTSFTTNTSRPQISPTISGPSSSINNHYAIFSNFGAQQLGQMHPNFDVRAAAGTGSITQAGQSQNQFNGLNLPQEPMSIGSTSVSGIPTTTATTGAGSTTGLNQATPASVDSGSTSALSPQTRSKRRQNTNPDATRRIVVANFSNETDALEILAHAATDGDEKEDGEGKVEGDESSGAARRGKKVSFKDQGVRLLSEYLLVKKGILDEGVLWGLVKFYFDHYHPVLPLIQTPRVPRNPLDLPRLASSDPFLLSCLVLVASAYHPDPAIRLIHDQTWAIVRDTLSDYAFGGVEASLGLVEGALLLAEFLPREKKSKATPGDISGSKSESRENTLSLLGTGPAQGGLHGNENRRTWVLTGLAIRAAYGLQLDQASMDVEAPASLEEDRARLAWTWCYLYDRTIGLRTGLAFWSRGPSICFSGYSHISQTGEIAARDNFLGMFMPTSKEFERVAKARRATRSGKAGKREPGRGEVDLDMDFESPAANPEDGVIRGQGSDSACLIQALMELTQVMTNAHDQLYPSRMRTNDLVQQGAYFRFLDAFRRALESFKLAWKPRQWQSECLKELTWCTYEMVRLYVSSFAFQAHVQRAWMRAEEEAVNGDSSGSGGASGGSVPAAGAGAGGGLGMGMSMPLGNGVGAKEGVQLFPRGSATSPDALYIYASIDAANEILSICLRLSKLGTLGYLPSRYLINFVFGGVFALKAGYSGAVSQKENVKTRELVDRVCAALVLASPDRDHPASRYGQMLRLLSKKLDELSDQSAVPSRFPTPDPEEGDSAAHTDAGTTDWNQLLLDHPNFRNLQAMQAQNQQSGQPGIGNNGMSFGGQNNDSNAFSPSHLQGSELDSLMASGLAHTGLTPSQSQMGHSHMMQGGQGQGGHDPVSLGVENHGMSVPQISAGAGAVGNAGNLTGLEGLFDFDVDVNFNLDGFWDDFTLAEGSGFPFR